MYVVHTFKLHRQFSIYIWLLIYFYFHKIDTDNPGNSWIALCNFLSKVRMVWWALPSLRSASQGWIHHTLPRHAIDICNWNWSKWFNSSSSWLKVSPMLSISGRSHTLYCHHVNMQFWIYHLVLAGLLMYLGTRYLIMDMDSLIIPLPFSPTTPLPCPILPARKSEESLFIFSLINPRFGSFGNNVFTAFQQVAESDTGEKQI